MRPDRDIYNEENDNNFEEDDFGLEQDVWYDDDWSFWDNLADETPGEYGARNEVEAWQFSGLVISAAMWQTYQNNY